MGETTVIAWTDSTFNPWMGCTKVSEACTHCYAERDTKRYGLVEWGPGAERKRTSEHNWNNPRRWNRQAGAEGRRQKVFCASFADVFEDLPELDPFRADLWKLIEECPNLDWQLLTKRPENMKAMAPWETWPNNVWVGCTIELQKYEVRIYELLKVPARIHFVSCEPLLGPLNLAPFFAWYRCTHCGATGGNDSQSFELCSDETIVPSGISWVITGGESGTGFRTPDEEWIRSLRDQTRKAKVPFFYKQGSGFRPEKEPMLDGARYMEFPVSVAP